MAKLFKPGDTTPTDVRPGDGREKFTLKELQEIVGGYIEPACRLVVSDDLQVTMLADEDGIQKELPINAAATALAREALQCDVTIVGNALLICNHEWE